MTHPFLSSLATLAIVGLVSGNASTCGPTRPSAVPHCDKVTTLCFHCTLFCCPYLTSPPRLLSSHRRGTWALAATPAAPLTWACQSTPTWSTREQPPLHTPPAMPNRPHSSLTHTHGAMALWHPPCPAQVSQEVPRIRWH